MAMPRTPSTELSGSGRSCAEPTMNVAAAPTPFNTRRRDASESSAVEMSTPITRAPLRASSSEFSPDPQPKSRMVRPETSPSSEYEYSSGYAVSLGGFKYRATLCSSAMSRSAGVCSASNSLRLISACSHSLTDTSKAHAPQRRGEQTRFHQNGWFVHTDGVFGARDLSVVAY